MNRRAFLIQSAACALLAGTPLAASAQRRRFEPTRFSVRVEGSGRDVILVPGLTAGRGVWARAVRAVPGYRYHLVQVGGFAGEPVGGNGEGPVIGPLAEELARYIEERGLRRPAVVGHSMGGIVAMMLAARHPERVGRVMVVDMLPRPTGLFGGSGGALGQFAERLRGVAGDPIGRQLLGSIVSAFTPPEVARSNDADVVARALHELGTTDLAGELAQIRAPLTVVHAVADEGQREPARQGYADAYAPVRDLRLVTVTGSGHMIMNDQPDRFADALRDFLD